MSIIKAVQDFLSTYPGMELQPLPKVLTDRPEAEPSSYAVAPAGGGTIKKDVTGNRTYQNSYVFFAKEHAAAESDRRDNYDFLEGLSDWIEQQADAGSFPALPAGYEALDMQVNNPMLFDLNDDGTGLYQVQFQLIFTRKRSV